MTEHSVINVSSTLPTTHYLQMKERRGSIDVVICSTTCLNTLSKVSRQLCLMYLTGAKLNHQYAIRSQGGGGAWKYPTSPFCTCCRIEAN